MINWLKETFFYYSPSWSSKKVVQVWSEHLNPVAHSDQGKHCFQTYEIWNICIVIDSRGGGFVIVGIFNQVLWGKTHNTIVILITPYWATRNPVNPSILLRLPFSVCFLWGGGGWLHQGECKTVNTVYSYYETHTPHTHLHIHTKSVYSCYTKLHPHRGQWAHQHEWQLWPVRRKQGWTMMNLLNNNFWHLYAWL